MLRPPPPADLSHELDVACALAYQAAIAILNVREEAQANMKHELELNRQQVGVGDSVMLAERAMRRAFRDDLEKAHAFLSRFSGGSDRVQRIGAALSQIPAHEQRLDQYFVRMDQLVDEKVEELRADIGVERQLMNDHRESMRELVTASQNGAGVLAYLNFMRTQNDFNEFILRGDVGIIDVVWEKKEDMSNKIGDLFEERTTELRLLQESFEEVR